LRYSDKDSDLRKLYAPLLLKVSIIPLHTTSFRTLVCLAPNFFDSDPTVDCERLRGVPDDDALLQFISTYLIAILVLTFLLGVSLLRAGWLERAGKKLVVIRPSFQIFSTQLSIFLAMVVTLFSKHLALRLFFLFFITFALFFANLKLQPCLTHMTVNCLRGSIYTVALWLNWFGWMGALYPASPLPFTFAMLGIYPMWKFGGYICMRVASSKMEHKLLRHYEYSHDSDTALFDLVQKL